MDRVQLDGCVYEVSIAYRPLSLKNGGQGQYWLMAVGRVHHGKCVYEVSLIKKS